MADHPEPTAGSWVRSTAGPGVLKALAHPLRQRILDHLHIEGPATSTTLSHRLDQNTGTLSYHLRQLERGGLIEDVPDRASGRERWWRAVPDLDLRRPQRSSLTPEETAALDAFEDHVFAEDIDLARRYLERRGEFGIWAQGSRSLQHMTADELRQFHEAYLDLLKRFGHTVEDAPEGARPILLRFFALPHEPTD
ncbi:MAG: ArsR/SmtB family transcription factor [Pseudonocardia sp.]